MKKIIIIFSFFALLFSARQIHAQTFVFDTVTSTPGCPENIFYKFSPRLLLIGIRLNQIYSDNGDTSATGSSSFNFSLLFNYDNTFIDTAGNVMDTLHAGPFASTTFYTYLVTFYSHNPHVNPSYTMNNCNNVPLTTDISGVQFDNNNTYHGSASALGLTANTTYYNQNIIDMFGVDSASIVVNAPCLAYTAAPGLPVPSIPLAIGLSSFNATVKGSTVVVSWTTGSEHNNSGFLLQKSKEGIDWTNITRLPSQARNGISNEPLYYQYTDYQPWHGNNLYRLIEPDRYGEQVYSNIINVYYTASEIVVYPNPASQTIRVTGDTGKIILTDIAGRSIALAQPDASGYINVSGLQPGVYLLHTGDKISKMVICR